MGKIKCDTKFNLEDFMDKNIDFGLKAGIAGLCLGSFIGFFGQNEVNPLYFGAGVTAATDLVNYAFTKNGLIKELYDDFGTFIGFTVGYALTYYPIINLVDNLK